MQQIFYLLPRYIRRGRALDPTLLCKYLITRTPRIIKCSFALPVMQPLPQRIVQGHLHMLRTLYRLDKRLTVEQRPSAAMPFVESLCKAKFLRPDKTSRVFAKNSFMQMCGHLRVSQHIGSCAICCKCGKIGHQSNIVSVAQEHFRMCCHTNMIKRLHRT